MNRLLEKCAVLTICILGFAASDELMLPVAALLLTVAASAAVQIFSGKTAAAVILAGCALLCGFVPTMICAVPLILYDALCERKWWLILPAASAAAGFVPLRQNQLLTVGAGVLIAVILYFRVTHLEETVGRLTALRDDIAEKNIQLTEQNRRLAAAQDNEIHLATLKERNRIAREIHDNVGHMLTRSILQTAALQIVTKDDALREPLGELKTTLDSAMTSIRESVHDLHDDSIDLKKTLTELVTTDRFQSELHYDAGEHIPGEVKLCIAAIVREGVSNAVRHSDGDKLTVIFREHPAFYQLLIEDNGKHAEIRRGGIGLRNMEDRAADLGGRITFTASEQGFRIFMTVPKEQEYGDHCN